MRLDLYLSENGFCASRSRAQELIKNGCVSICGKIISKPSYDYAPGGADEITVDDNIQYVSRGGLKLKAAVDRFGIDVKGCNALDIGASTGGFTDCLLKEGARHVWCVDSGSGQLHLSLLRDDRVTSLENTNARYLTKDELINACGFDGFEIDIAVMDVSFISQTLIYDAVYNILKDGGIFVSLIKPQFEVGRDKIGKGGIVKDDKTRLYAIDKIKAAAKDRGFKWIGVIDSPICGGDGNREFVAVMKKL